MRKSTILIGVTIAIVSAIVISLITVGFAFQSETDSTGNNIITVSMDLTEGGDSAGIIELPSVEYTDEIKYKMAKTGNYKSYDGTTFFPTETVPSLADMYYKDSYGSRFQKVEEQYVCDYVSPSYYGQIVMTTEYTSENGNEYHRATGDDDWLNVGGSVADPQPSGTVIYYKDGHHSKFIQIGTTFSCMELDPSYYAHSSTGTVTDVFGNVYEDNVLSERIMYHKDGKWDPKASIEIVGKLSVQDACKMRMWLNFGNPITWIAMNDISVRIEDTTTYYCYKYSEGGGLVSATGAPTDVMVITNEMLSDGVSFKISINLRNNMDFDPSDYTATMQANVTFIHAGNNDPLDDTVLISAAI